LHPLFTVADLYIEYRYSGLVWKNNAIEGTLWLELSLPFTAAENLYLSREIVPGIAVSLQELVESRITEVLPSLRDIYVKEPEPLGPNQESIEQFVSHRLPPDGFPRFSVTLSSFLSGTSRFQTQRRSESTRVFE
jgi:hypothetical protein